MRSAGKLLVTLLTAIGAAQSPGSQGATAPDRTAVSPALAPPPPAIVLLLREPRALEARRVRRQLGRILKTAVGEAPAPTGVWLAADGDSLVGGRDGARWQVTCIAAARDLPDTAIAHLDVDEREQVLAHRAQILVAAEPPPTDTDDAARVATYGMLAGVAAALADRDVVGIGAAAHGTFSACSGDVAELQKQLVGDRPLAALAPIGRSSVVLFAAESPTLDAKELAAALAREFGVAVTSSGDGHDDDKDANFVVSKHPAFAIKLGGELTILTVGPPMHPDEAALEEYTDLRVRRALGEHRALLHLHCAGAADAAAEQRRRRTLARIAAALWNKDTMALSWHCDRHLVTAGVDVPKQLRSDDPVAATLGTSVSAVVEAVDEAAMRAAIEKARTEWPKAVASFHGGSELWVKFPFASRRGHEHIWVEVRAIRGDRVLGTIANEPMDVAGLQLGAEVDRPAAELSDWMYYVKGERVGGYTIDVLEAQERAAQSDKARKDSESPRGK